MFFYVADLYTASYCKNADLGEHKVSQQNIIV